MSSTKRILVVEDDSITSGAVKMVLEWEGIPLNMSGLLLPLGQEAGG